MFFGFCVGLGNVGLSSLPSLLDSCVLNLLSIKDAEFWKSRFVWVVCVSELWHGKILNFSYPNERFIEVLVLWFLFFSITLPNIFWHFFYVVKDSFPPSKRLLAALLNWEGRMVPLFFFLNWSSRSYEGHANFHTIPRKETWWIQ